MRFLLLVLLFYLSTCNKEKATKSEEPVQQIVPQTNDESPKEEQIAETEQPEDIKPTVDNVDPAFATYLKDFRFHAEVRLQEEAKQPIEIQFGDTEGAVGKCGRESMTVIVSKKFWDLANQLERELMLFHEFGHCFLRLGHIDDLGISIMNSILPDEVYYAEHKIRLLDRLFYRYQPTTLTDFREMPH